MRTLPFVIGAAAALAACDGTPASTLSQASHAAPAPALTLSPEARSQLAGSVDLSAMDRLLLMLDPADQQRLLATFADVEVAANDQPRAPTHETTDVSVIVRFTDPERQMLLERMWAPFWRQLPPSVLRDRTFPLPGRVIATRDTLRVHPGTGSRP
jgi:hypothetical protein